jgi:hypothetical protein
MKWKTFEEESPEKYESLYVCGTDGEYVYHVITLDGEQFFMEGVDSDRGCCNIFLLNWWIYFIPNKPDHPMINDFLNELYISDGVRI